jgi:hypothetical protein
MAAHRRRTRLQIVHSLSGRASVIGPPQSLPAFCSDDGEDQICGSCSAAIAEGISLNSVRLGQEQASSLIIVCPKIAARITFCRPSRGAPSLDGRSAFRLRGALRPAGASRIVSAPH